MDGDNSSIERLKRRLYSRKDRIGVHARRELSETKKPDVSSEWNPEPKPKMKKKVNTDKVLTAVLVASVVFFVGALGVSALLWIGERNTVSNDNISVEIQGPATIGGGEELVLQLVIANNNAAALQDADLLIEYPAGTRVPGNLSQEQLRTRESLGTLSAGEQVQKTARGVLFGEEGSTQTIHATIEYRVADSNAIFFKEQNYEIILSNAPMVIKVDSVEDISSGQEAEFDIEVTSNSDETLENVLLVAEYPFGFEFVDSDPEPYARTNVWRLGDLDPEEKKTIHMRGRILGEDAVERVFRFSSGTAGAVDDTKLETVFATAQQTIIVESPFINATLAINGSNTSEPVVERDELVRADISWANNLPDQIFDLEIEVELDGAILDESSVAARQGFYRSTDNTAFWSRETDGSFATVEEGEHGTVSLTFAPIPYAKGEGFRTPSVTLDITVRAKRVSENNVPETIESTITRTVKVETDVGLSAESAYSTGPFANSGPIPPRADQGTTYTILLTASNSTNPAGDVTVSATLPPYVEWLGAVNPTTADIAFSNVGGRVSWNVGSMQAHSSKTAAFQVKLLPSVSQVGSEPVLVNQLSIDGIDTFTTTRVVSSAREVTTRTTDSGSTSSATVQE